MSLLSHSLPQISIHLFLLLIVVLSLADSSRIPSYKDASGNSNPKQKQLGGTSTLCQDLIFRDLPQRPMTCIDPSTSLPTLIPIPSSDGEFWPLLPPRNISKVQTFLVRNINAVYTGGNVSFNLFVGGVLSQSLGMKIYFDFDGDTHWDRMEVFPPLPLLNAVQQSVNGTVFLLNSVSATKQVVGNFSRPFTGGTLRVDFWSASTIPGRIFIQGEGSRATQSNTSVLTIPFTSFTGSETFGKGAGDWCQSPAECQTDYLCVGPIWDQGYRTFCAPTCETDITACDVMVGSHNYELRIPEGFRQCNPFVTPVLRRGANCFPPELWQGPGPTPGVHFCSYICPEYSAAVFTVEDPIHVRACRCLPGYPGAPTVTTNFTCLPFVLNPGQCSLVQPCFATPNPPDNVNCDVSSCTMACETLEGTCSPAAIPGCNPSSPLQCQTCDPDCLLQMYPQLPTLVGNSFIFPRSMDAAVGCCTNCTAIAPPTPPPTAGG